MADNPQSEALYLLRKRGLSPRPAMLPPRVGGDYLGRAHKEIVDSNGRQLGSVDGVEDPVDFNAGLRGQDASSQLGKMMNFNREKIEDDIERGARRRSLADYGKKR